MDRSIAEAVGTLRETLVGGSKFRPGALPILRLYSGEIVGRQLDWPAVRGAAGGAVPSVTVPPQILFARDSLLGHQALESGEPVPVVGLASMRIAGSLRPLDLVCQNRRPLAPGEEPALMQGQRNCEDLRLPRLVEYRPPSSSCTPISFVLNRAIAPVPVSGQPARTSTTSIERGQWANRSA